MKRWLIPLLALLLPLAVSAQQQQIAEIASHLATDRITLHYDCVFTQDTPVHLTGVLTIQGSCYRAEGNGMEIYNDGTTRWTVDPKSKEVYIEPAEGLEDLLAWQESLTELKLSGVAYSPMQEDLSGFRFDTASLDDSWVVTDLR
ncbi:MAG: hypothetical protein K5849_02090 [Bacteroidales bacterium]|nr:hypothetical protein [Bacteroidales bacterium]